MLKLFILTVMGVFEKYKLVELSIWYQLWDLIHCGLQNTGLSVCSIFFGIVFCVLFCMLVKFKSMILMMFADRVNSYGYGI